MSIKTNHELVVALKNVVSNYKTLYVMGCFGAPLSGANVSRYCTNHTYNKQAARTAMIKAAADKNPPVFGFDCVCLIKGLLWGWNGDGSKSYGGASYAVNGVPDIGADQMITKCIGVTTDFSKIEVGEAVWMSGHIGVYIGDGKAIECTPSFNNNVQITAVKNIGSISGMNSRTWTKHGKLPYITYDGSSTTTAPTGSKPTLRKGDSGESVKELQRLLGGIAADGSFGSLTEAALKSFQATNKLAVDGVCGPLTWAALLAKQSTPGASAPATAAPAPSGDVLTLAVKHAAEIIYANEGNYGSVNKNDNGALSIGKVQWHASRALALMQTIVKDNPMQAQNTLGLTLYNEILKAAASAWNTRIVNANEAAAISKLLETSEGKAAQDALAIADITSYVKKGQSYGLTDCGALIYFADGVNQYGTGAALWKNIAETALKAAGDVAAMWTATKALTQNYLTRREKVCKAVLALKLGGSTTTTPAPSKSIDEIAKEVINGKWGNGQDRTNRLTAAGYDAKAVQQRVNALLK